METSKNFKGSIVIGDPSYFIKDDHDWEASEYGHNLSNIGFSYYFIIEFPDDSQIVINEDTKDTLGGICQDSGTIAVIYKHELETYNPDYEQDFFDENNRTIIENFDGNIGYKTVPVVVDGYEDEDTIISGRGNINFTSCYED